MGNYAKSALGVFIAIAVIVGMLSVGVLFLFTPEEKLSVEATQSPTKDAYGYMWIDSLSPDPKIEYDWIDVSGNPKAVWLSKIKHSSYYAGDNANWQNYELPFAFPFYGETYTDVNVAGCGYVDVNGWDYSYYPGYNYFYQIPYSGYENGFIAAWGGYIGAYYYYQKGDFKVFALEGQTYGERWVCFEWYKAYCQDWYVYYGTADYQINFQMILYESGLIKFQYKDADSIDTWSSNGNSAFAGIEDPTGTVGLTYSGYNDANLKSGLAVMIGNNVAKIDDVQVDVETGGAVYALYRDYSIAVECTHPVNNDLLRVVVVSIGGGLTELLYYQSNDGSFFFTKNDPNGYLQQNPLLSSKEVTPQGTVLIQFSFSPTFAFPLTTFQSVTIKVLGAGIMPTSLVIPDLFYVENKLMTAGAPVGYSEEKGVIENGGWVRGNELWNLRGLRAVYPGTTKSPRVGAIWFSATDDQGTVWTQTEVTSGIMNVPIVSENDYQQRTYIMNITNVPLGTDLSENTPYVMNVDPFKPLPPKDLRLHADSYDDRNTEYDDDTSVFVSWEPAEDFESGIRGYYVADYDPLGETRADGNVLYVPGPDTSTVYEFSMSGAMKVWVWAIDKAGNPSIPVSSLIKVDTVEVTFSEFSPGDSIWVNTHTPVCSILMDDTGGSGVSARDIQYSVSTTTPFEFGAWVTGTYPRSLEQIRYSVKTTFVNGKTNYVRFRAKDVAGNGWTESATYNVWVDEEEPLFTNFRPFESEYQSGESVVVGLDITDRHSNREGSGVKEGTVEYRYSTAGKGLYGDWVEAPISSVNEDGVVHVEMELRFKAGDQNYIQFRCYDNVGNFAQSKDYNIKVNSAPVVKVYVEAPKNGISYVTTERVMFDASGTRDNDGDELTFTWYSDIDGQLSERQMFFRALSAGVHDITLIVNDPSHSVVYDLEVRVLEEEQIDPESIDSDGDGIYDAWEIRYGLRSDVDDGFMDADHDMFSNLEEFKYGTDPTRASSHPPYDDIAERSDPLARDDKNDQYQAITFALLLLGLVVVVVLVLLFLSRRRMYLEELDEDRELTADEEDYLKAVEGRKRK